MSQNLQRFIASGIRIGGMFPGGGSRTSFALDSAYVNGTSGDGVAIRYISQIASKITEVYVYCDSKTGSPSTFTCDIYNEHASNSARTGSTSRSSSTSVTLPSGAAGWMKFDTFSNYTPTVGEILWIVIHNTTGTPSSNYINVLTATNTVFAVPTTSIALGHNNTAGFSTNGTTAVEMPFVINHGGTYVGQPFTQRNSRASASTEMGFQFTPTEDMKATAWFTSAGGASNYSDLRILADATAPGGSALYTYDLDSDANETTCDVLGAKFFDSEITLSGGTTYKCTVTYGTATTTPSYAEIEDYATYSTMFDTLRGYDLTQNPWMVIDNGAGGWTTYKDRCLDSCLVVVDNPAISSGGGLIRHPGMNGGLNG